MLEYKIHPQSITYTIKPIPGAAFGSLTQRQTDRLCQVLDGRILGCNPSSLEEAPERICVGFLSKKYFALKK